MSTRDEGPYRARLDKVCLRKGNYTCAAQRAIKQKTEAAVNKTIISKLNTKEKLKFFQHQFLKPALCIINLLKQVSH